MLEKKGNVPPLGQPALYALLFAVMAMSLGCSRGAQDQDSVAALRSTASQPVASNSASTGALHGKGVYAEKGGDPYCCWISQDAVIHIDLPPSSTKLRLMVLVPNYPATHRQRLSLSVVINGRQAGHFILKFGGNPLVVPLPSNTRGAHATVELRPSFSFVPKDEHMNGDTRRLSLLLTSLQPE